MTVYCEINIRCSPILELKDQLGRSFITGISSFKIKVLSAKGNAQGILCIGR
jgi:hypothetical protein